MRRVVITGMGIISSIGNNIEEVEQSLYNGSSGIIFAEDYKEWALEVMSRAILTLTLKTI